MRTAFDMFWEILWPLMLGFALSGVIQAVLSHKAMARLLGWQFAAEYVGGVLKVVLLALILRFTLTRSRLEQARTQARSRRLPRDS